MVFIRTSKTRDQMMRQPQERAKYMTERRQKTVEKHSVYSVKPVNGMSEEEVHEALDDQGSGIAEAMAANVEENERKAKEKQRLQKEKLSKSAQGEVAKRKERDRQKGLLK